MAVLKYKDENGNYQEVVGINVQNEVVQTTGSSTTAVMSQKAVSDLIPAQASLNNQLADKDFVNSSITTATATYQGSYNLVSDLELTTQASHGTIEQALNTEIASADNNDYSFVQIPTSDSTPTEIASVERYKYNGTTWSYEYAINNSGFTAAQWAAVNSNITSGLVAQLNALSGNPQTSISKLFGMDASGNFQNISTSDLASVLGVNEKIIGSSFIMPAKSSFARKIATINTSGFRKNGFQFTINGYGISAIGIFALHSDGDPNNPTACIVKNKEATYGACKFIVVKESSPWFFSVYITGTYPSSCTSYMAIIPTDNYTYVTLGDIVDVTSLTAYSAVDV